MGQIRFEYGSNYANHISLSNTIILLKEQITLKIKNK
jgi:hypothetical protein